MASREHYEATFCHRSSSTVKVTKYVKHETIDSTTAPATKINDNMHTKNAKTEFKATKYAKHETTDSTKASTTKINDNMDTKHAKTEFATAEIINVINTKFANIDKIINVMDTKSADHHKALSDALEKSNTDITTAMSNLIYDLQNKSLSSFADFSKALGNRTIDVMSNKFERMGTVISDSMLSLENKVHSSPHPMGSSQSSSENEFPLDVLNPFPTTIPRETFAAVAGPMGS